MLLRRYYVRRERKRAYFRECLLPASPDKCPELGMRARTIHRYDPRSPSSVVNAFPTPLNATVVVNPQPFRRVAATAMCDGGWTRADRYCRPHRVKRATAADLTIGAGTTPRGTYNTAALHNIVQIRV